MQFFIFPEFLSDVFSKILQKFKKAAARAAPVDIAFVPLVKSGYIS